MHISSELKRRLIEFLKEINNSPEGSFIDDGDRLETNHLLGELDRKPGRPVGWRKKKVDNTAEA